MASFIKPVLTILLIALVGFGVFKLNRPSFDDRFLELLNYEAQNRLYAHASTKQLAKNEDDKSYRDFWTAYHRMEEHNQDVYSAVLNINGIDNSPDWLTQLKTWGSTVSIPEAARTAALSQMRNATRRYILKLKEMQELAPKKDAIFFQYVVEQEQVQADALALVVDGKVHEGTILLTDFVAEQRRQLST